MKKFLFALLSISLLTISCDDPDGGVGNGNPTGYTKLLKRVTFPENSFEEIEFIYDSNNEIDTIKVYATFGTVNVVEEYTITTEDTDTIYNVRTLHSAQTNNDTTYSRIKKTWVNSTKVVTHYAAEGIDVVNNNVVRTYTFEYDGNTISKFISEDDEFRWSFSYSYGDTNRFTYLSTKKEGTEPDESTEFQFVPIDKANPYEQIDFLNDVYYLGVTPLTNFSTLLGSLTGRSPEAEDENEGLLRFDFEYEYDEEGHPIKIIETLSGSETGTQVYSLEWQ
ncbi:MAG: hypothetical protein Kapaf2KO_07400 [Candidatus Kapaibacteriales bacterium]